MSVVIRRDAVAAQRWKNGGGAVRELLLRPDSADWRVRIAVAEIETDGPFSEFPGVTRHFTVIAGNGVELTIGDAGAATLHRLRVGDPTLRFDGGAPTSCRLLGGRALALNLMLRGAAGRVEAVRAGDDWAPAADACGLYTAVAGRCGGIDLPAESLVWFDSAPAGLRFDPVPASEAPTGPPGWWLATNHSEIRQ
ncbi:HutD family protein [Piscinibacter sakaiensis]|uniref:HutD/Ves family protein n=1 Tax=Piscinibacter sakaiensis TaxID=1547922 RepID=UPI003AB0BBAF